ncbi:MAG: cytochrome c oxidase subunit 3 family protein [Cocleimonas sp.]|nr:cytochrome c oxidase subunit 3 family protein [Cocleimonas sp.]
MPEATQQPSLSFREKIGDIPGSWAIWAAILAEMSEFAIMFIVYFLAKVHNPELFYDGPTRLSTVAGTANTLIMLTSSFFVIRAVMAMRNNKPKASAQWLWGAVACGVLYLIIKYFEYQWNTSQGLDTETNIFYGVYYYVTFNHFLHVGWGSAAIVWVIYRINTGIYTKDEHEGLINIALYWHMIDLAWITIFPLLYVIR